MVLKLSDEVASLELNRGNYAKVFPGYITHIRFPRYKNIADGTRIDFSFPVTALVGFNGSGKTSVLNALFGAPARKSTGQYWFSTKVDPIEEGDGSPSRFIYGHRNPTLKAIVETRKARVRKMRGGRLDPNYWEPTKESAGDDMAEPLLQVGRTYSGRSKDRWNPVTREVLYINFRKELSAFDKYFYFGKDPVPITPAGKAAKASPRRITSKMDQVRHDAGWLARVIDAADTSVEWRGRKVATENRLLTPDELDVVSYILGRSYEEARWIKHRLFKGEGGLSVVFKTKHGRYSEAFAGSGEVAVTSCVVQIMKASRGTLVLLDEPEVSLHPGAQERLLAFLTRMARTRQLQVVFSTHSPHLVTALPDDAIKTFHQLDDGSFTVIPSTHPYAAFRRLGAVAGGEVRVLVEDWLAQQVVQHALRTLEDQAQAAVFKVEYFSGGADALLKYQVPVLMGAPGHTLVLLDGDKKRIPEFVDPDTIPQAQNNTLGARIKEATNVEPAFTVDGGATGGDAAQRVAAQRKYLAWLRQNLDFLPNLCPEELVLRAAGKVDPTSTTSGHHKSRLRELAMDVYGEEATSDRIDRHGEALLAMNRASSAELPLLAQRLVVYLAALRLRQLPALP
jgi:predicted ATPase